MEATAQSRVLYCKYVLLCVCVCLEAGCGRGEDAAPTYSSRL